jgi:glutaconate CoA-transferase subunit B
VPKVEFISAPGWSPPEVQRRGGPVALLTGKALFSWQKNTHRFRLESTHEPADARAETGFDFDSPANVPVTPQPSSADLKLLRGPVAQQIAADYPDFARRVWDGFRE